MILRQEQRTGNGAAPQAAVIVGARGFQTEQIRHARPVRFALRERGRGDFLPRDAIVLRALQLHPEMAERLRGIQAVVARIGQQHGDRIAEEAGACNRPFAARAAQVEQALSRADKQTLAHDITYPPDNAWNTKTSSASPTRSLR